MPITERRLRSKGGGGEGVDEKPHSLAPTHTQKKRTVKGRHEIKASSKTARKPPLPGPACPPAGLGGPGLAAALLAALTAPAAGGGLRRVLVARGAGTLGGSGSGGGGGVLALSLLDHVWAEGCLLVVGRGCEFVDRGTAVRGTLKTPPGTSRFNQHTRNNTNTEALFSSSQSLSLSLVCIIVVVLLGVFVHLVLLWPPLLPSSSLASLSHSSVLWILRVVAVPRFSFCFSFDRSLLSVAVQRCG